MLLGRGTEAGWGTNVGEKESGEGGDRGVGAREGREGDEGKGGDTWHSIIL